MAGGEASVTLNPLVADSDGNRAKYKVSATSLCTKGKHSCTRQKTTKGTLNTYFDVSLCHFKSIWLFTYSDLKTIIFPESIFGTMNAIAAQSFDIESSRLPSQILQRFPLVLLWTWINLLPFAIDNQWRPDSILEDSINKPRRPLPTKRLSPYRAKQIMFTLWPIAVLASLHLGGLWPSVALIFLAYWYNEGRGADSSCITRNFVNTCGFSCYSIGAMEVALGSPVVFTSRMTHWFLIIGFVVFTTVHTQDLSDQEGDSLHNRRTVPLVVGDHLTRVLTAFPMAFFCVFCPWYWDSYSWIYATSAGMAGLIITRMLTKKSVKDDKRTFVLWNEWLVFLLVGA